MKNKISDIHGDHLTYLKVYKSWKEALSKGHVDADEYCADYGINANILYDADELLRKLTRACQKSNPLVPMQDTQSNDSEGLLRQLAHAFIDNIATANDPLKTKLESP
jgi:hypothetical protein